MVVTRRLREESAELDRRAERLSKRDIFKVPEIRENPLSVILIKRFTVAERLDARAMVEALCGFVKSKSVDHKLEFIFSVYDMDQDGLVSSKDLFEIIKILNRGILEDWKVQNIVDRTLAKTGEYKLTMTCEEFKTLVRQTTKNLNAIFGCHP